MQESPVQREKVTFYSQMRICMEMRQKKKWALRTGMLRTARKEERKTPSRVHSNNK